MMNTLLLCFARPQILVTTAEVMIDHLTNQPRSSYSYNVLMSILPILLVSQTPFNSMEKFFKDQQSGGQTES